MFYYPLDHMVGFNDEYRITTRLNMTYIRDSYMRLDVEKKIVVNSLTYLMRCIYL